MPWLRRHAAWTWSAILLLGIALVVATRFGPVAPSASEAGLPSDTSGVVTGDSSSLAATARRLRTLLEETGAIREQLAAAQTDLSVRRERIAALDQMLAADSLTECPAFLRDETTVRALQKIIRDARESEGPLVPAEAGLSTAATIARERLRGRLEAIREQLRQETAALEANCENLRRQLSVESEELDRLQQQVQKQLQNSSAGEARYGPGSETQ